MDNAFSQSPADDDVLFYLPVTRAWLKQVVLCLALLCHSSMRGISELMGTIFDIEMSPATVHTIIHDAIPQARRINATYPLCAVRAGAHDELFQGKMPVLGGMDLNSGYCYLLSPAEHRDADTWAIHLLDCAEQGLHPDYIVADGGTGLRAGQALVWDDVPCFGDNFHIIREITGLSGKLDKTAYLCLVALDKLECRILRQALRLSSGYHSAQVAQAKQAGNGNKLSKALAQARVRTATAIRVADTARTLCGWLRNDILSLSGPQAAIRAELYDFICASLQELETDEPRISTLRRSLENQKSQALAFAYKLDGGIAEIAECFKIPQYPVRLAVELHTRKPESKGYYALERAIYRQIHHYFHPVREAVAELLENIHRSSSLIENLNGRLRNYFFLRRQIGPDYLELLRFFLNHHPFARSAHAEKIGKSPAEMLIGEKHPHWLEFLGFTLFKRSAEAA